MKHWIFVLLGAVAGGLVGYFGFLWIARQGFYALVLPGGLLGVGASLVQTRSTSICVLCGLLALALGLLAEWQFAPFIRDGSLGYFLAHIHQLKPITLVMIAAGACIGFWAPFSRRQRLCVPRTLPQARCVPWACSPSIADESFATRCEVVE